ncbi:MULTISPECIES: TetR/AcrR family transcriptional regulator [unclassified Crossiella]|uniref:TetR/AcrR family transcriptional regulator n=1 Tax=unclassified Crossiella TaxID=2620835 RepID=UPI001FFF135C|nr:MULTISPECIES: TetR/AcrR family transcriptional regulator C-terminal domain-containing protein [unclassified Crossiella]MCK2240469.1 TetR/AcrR family transcriptional regulator C-terminal domain-containing protein [Crossiella sp. S99.2]MCK2253080.1 TetR/AcrR family transcriptional regulator C-terminal domain-containing protein [Crossiella sp. S99.1]
MRSSASERGPRVFRGEPPLTAELIVDAAERLTAEAGLAGWTVRKLATELDCWPTVIYHHVGDRAAVHHAVADRVVSRMPCPAEDLDWREWFTELLLGARPVLRGYPGVARWLVLRGPIVPSALRILDRGVRVLQRAGFGAESPMVYSTLLNAAILLIMSYDERSAEDANTKITITEALGAYRDDPREGLAAMAEYLLTPGMSEQFYAFTIDRAIAGAQARLTELGCG